MIIQLVRSSQECVFLAKHRILVVLEKYKESGYSLLASLRQGLGIDKYRHKDNSYMTFGHRLAKARIIPSGCKPSVI